MNSINLNLTSVDWSRLKDKLETVVESNNDKLDVAIYGCAIRKHLWSGLCNLFASTNKCSFKIVFCGHIQPTTQLPENFVFIYSDSGPAACAEIAYRYAMSLESKYVFNFQDDLIPNPEMLDVLIRSIEDPKSEDVVGPAFKPATRRSPINIDLKSSSGSGRKLGGGSDRGLGLNYLFMRRELAEKVGGIDKRWSGGAPGVIEDLSLRLEVMGKTFRSCIGAVVAEDENERHPAPLKRLSQRSAWSNDITRGRQGPDQKLYRYLWNPLGRGSGPWKNIKRADEVQYYEDHELHFHICSNECTNSIHKKK